MATNHPGISWGMFASGAVLAFTVTGAGWTLFQDKFTQAEKADTRATVEIFRLRDELLSRRHEFITTEEFRDFKERVLDRLSADERRLDVIEATRPSAGTLDAVNKSNEAQLGRFEDRLRSLEAAPKGQR